MRMHAFFVATLIAATGSARADGAAPNVITKVQAKDQGGLVTVSIEGSKPANFTTFSMMDPPRFVVDIAGSAFKGVPDTLKVGGDTVVAVKCLAYGNGETASARVMVTLQHEVDPPDVVASGNTVVVKIGKGTTGLVAGAKAAPKAEATAPAEPKAAAEKAVAKAEPKGKGKGKTKEPEAKPTRPVGGEIKKPAKIEKPTDAELAEAQWWDAPTADAAKPAPAAAKAPAAAPAPVAKAPAPAAAPAPVAKAPAAAPAPKPAAAPAAPAKPAQPEPAKVAKAEPKKAEPAKKDDQLGWAAPAGGKPAAPAKAEKAAPEKVAKAEKAPKAPKAEPAAKAEKPEKVAVAAAPAKREKGKRKLAEPKGAAAEVTGSEDDWWKAQDEKERQAHARDERREGKKPASLAMDDDSAPVEKVKAEPKPEKVASAEPAEKPAKVEKAPKAPKAEVAAAEKPVKAEKPAPAKAEPAAKAEKPEKVAVAAAPAKHEKGKRRLAEPKGAAAEVTGSEDDWWKAQDDKERQAHARDERREGKKPASLAMDDEGAPVEKVKAEPKAEKVAKAAPAEKPAKAEKAPKAEKVAATEKPAKAEKAVEAKPAKAEPVVAAEKPAKSGKVAKKSEPKGAAAEETGGEDDWWQKQDAKEKASYDKQKRAEAKTAPPAPKAKPEAPAVAADEAPKAPKAAPKHVAPKAEAVAAGDEPLAPEPPKAKAPRVARADHVEPSEPRQEIREVGFRPLATGQRVFVRASEAPRFTISEAGEKLIRVELPNAVLANRNITRPLDTSFFPGAVQLVRSTRQGRSTVLEIALKEKVAYQQRVDGDTLSIDFDLPAGTPRAAIAPASPPPPPAPAPSPLPSPASAEAPVPAPVELK